MKRLVWMLIACGVVACGPPEDDGENVTFENNENSQVDMGNSDAVVDMSATDADPDRDRGMDVAPDLVADMAADTDSNNQMMPCGTDECGPGEECQDDACVVVDSCAAALDLGELTPGTPVTVDGSFVTDGADTIAATCGEPDQPERVVRFELASRSQVTYEADWTGQFDGLVELRTGCDDSTTSVVCTDVESGSPVLEPGTYFVVLETRLGTPGEFSLTLTAEEAACTQGTSACVGDQLQICADPTSPDLYQCAGGCADMVCGGDTCGNAIEVTAASGGIFQGVSGGYDSNLNFGGNLDCTTADGMPIATPGYDVVFHLPGLQQSDIVSVDADTSDPNINAIFILSACDDTAACVETFKDEQPDWVVETPGDYFLVIDKRNVSSTEFQYSVDVL